MNIDKERVTTGIALIIAVLLIGWLNSYLVIWTVLGVAFMIALNEAMKLFKQEDSMVYIYGAGLWVVSFFYPSADDLTFLAIITYLSYMLYTQSVDLKKFYPLFYPTVPFLFFLSLYKVYGMESLLWLVLVVALTDTSAYFVGKAIGKTKFCEISPNKTLEGVLGGIIVATILGSLFGASLVSWYGAILVSALVSVASIFGDLYESYLKRTAGVKDSGDILPGHGGILDRFDGFLFAVVVMNILLGIAV